MNDQHQGHDTERPYIFAEATPEQQAKARQSALSKKGDMRLVWITESALTESFLPKAEVEARIEHARTEWLAELKQDTDELMEQARLDGLETAILVLEQDAKAVRTNSLMAEVRNQVAEHFIARLRALAGAPRDMVLVPREPTNEMIHAGGYALQDYASETMDAARIAWDAMVKAALKGEGDE